MEKKLKESSRVPVFQRSNAPKLVMFLYSHNIFFFSKTLKVMRTSVNSLRLKHMSSSASVGIQPSLNFLYYGLKLSSLV